MVDKEPGEVRWLHLSDLHARLDPTAELFRTTLLNGKNEACDEGAPDEEMLRSGGLLRLLDEANVDCILITGDFFDRGVLNSESENELCSFLEELYNACSESGNWGWTRGEPMDRLFYCPGNHDLPRDCSLQNGIETIGRNANIRRVADNSIDQGVASFDDLHRKLFVNTTFGPFATAMHKMTGVEDYYEAHPFQIEPQGDGDYSPVVFAGINTAVFAGQPADQDEAIDSMASSLEAFREKHDRLNSAEAKREYDKYDLSLRRYLGKVVDDEGRLTLPSESALASIDAELTGEQRPIVVVFGHHPLEYLSRQAVVKLRSRMNRWGSKLYLCGHVHRADGRPIKPYKPQYDMSFGASCYQLAVGASHYDETDYSHTSFAIGSIKQQYNGNRFTYSYRLTLFEYDKNIFNEYVWTSTIKERQGLTYRNIRQQPQEPAGNPADFEEDAPEHARERPEITIDEKELRGKKEEIKKVKDEEEWSGRRNRLTADYFTIARDAFDYGKHDDDE